MRCGNPVANQSEADSSRDANPIVFELPPTVRPRLHRLQKTPSLPLDSQLNKPSLTDWHDRPSGGGGGVRTQAYAQASAWSK